MCQSRKLPLLALGGGVVALLAGCGHSPSNSPAGASRAPASVSSAATSAACAAKANDLAPLTIAGNPTSEIIANVGGSLNIEQSALVHPTDLVYSDLLAPGNQNGMGHGFVFTAVTAGVRGRGKVPAGGQRKSPRVAVMVAEPSLVVSVRC